MCNHTKCMNWKCIYFFYILIRSINCTPLLTYLYFSLDHNFDSVITRFQKKERHCYFTLPSRIQICNQNLKIPILNLDLSIGTPYPRSAITIPPQDLEIYSLAYFKEKTLEKFYPKLFFSEKYILVWPPTKHTQPQNEKLRAYKRKSVLLLLGFDDAALFFLNGFSSIYYLDKNKDGRFTRWCNSF